jgi:hypothetical protein
VERLRGQLAPLDFCQPIVQVRRSDPGPGGLTAAIEDAVCQLLQLSRLPASLKLDDLLGNAVKRKANSARCSRGLPFRGIGIAFSAIALPQVGEIQLNKSLQLGSELVPIEPELLLSAPDGNSVAKHVDGGKALIGSTLDEDMEVSPPCARARSSAWATDEDGFPSPMGG